MIPPGELHIGNFFIDTVGAYCEANTVQSVHSISQDGVNKWQDMGASGVCRFDQMKPIPITPEILKKCGFEYRQNTPFLSIDLPNNAGELSINAGAGGGRGIVWFKRRGISIGLTPIEYVHELQNTYYWFCKEQLFFILPLI